MNTCGPDYLKKETVEEREIKSTYRYWRLRIFYSIYMGYALFYFTRKSFALVMPGLSQHLGYEKAELGFIITLLSFSYGLSKLLNGLISDKANLRLFMSFGLILTGVCNILCGFSSSIPLFALFVGLNGLFQGWGAPPCAKFLTYWYSKKERGRWWGLWNTSHNLGGALIPLVCAFALHHFGWQYGFYIPGVLAIGVGCVLLNRLRDRPETVGLPSIEVFHGEKVAEEIDVSTDKQPTTREILVEHILRNKFMWLLAMAFFFVYIVRQIMNDWFVFFATEVKGYTILEAVSGVSLFEIGGAIGALVAGWLSDVVFFGKRAPVNIFFSFGILGALFVVWLMPENNLWALNGAMGMMGFFVFGPQMLIGMAAAELVDKGAAGTATGFVGFFAYLGGCLAGAPCGKVIDQFGYLALFVSLGVTVILTILLLTPLLIKRVRVPTMEVG